MTPYYEQDGITIFNADCRDVLPTLAAGSVDLVLTDPPYGISYRGGVGGNLIHSKKHRKQERVVGDDEPFDPTPLLAFPNVAMFGAQHYGSRLPDGGTLHVWDKRGDYKPVHTSDFDTVWINRKEPGRILRCVWRGICRETEAQQKIVHPTQKPILVVSWILAMFPSATAILDPYMGSGTTLVAARQAGLRAIGIEIEEKYAEIAAKRLQQSVMQFEGAA
ncbi:MAG: DNA-methyltransferase [Thermomicrobiales bacterium]